MPITLVFKNIEDIKNPVAKNIRIFIPQQLNLKIKDKNKSKIEAIKMWGTLMMLGIFFWPFIIAIITAILLEKVVENIAEWYKKLYYLCIALPGADALDISRASAPTARP